ncbi:MAG: DUF819 family protein [Bacillota bacterium]|jgi:uncharacterized membrane protein|nr:MAG: DUF819 family protein [Bacillota bacterium]
MTWVLVFALAPACVLVAVKRVRVLGWLGPTIICYLIGILLANLPVSVDHSVSMMTAQVAVLVAIPLLLLSTDFVRWLRLARSTLISFLLACVSVLLVSAVGAFVFKDAVADSWKVAGMFVGVYTGGTANMSAIGLALGVSEETFILVNAADVVVGGLYLLFLMTAAQRVLLKFLPPFRSSGGGEPSDGAGRSFGGAADPIAWRPFSAVLPQILTALGVAVLIVGASVGLAILLTGGLAETLILLAITTFGIAASFVPRLRSLEGAPEFGQYLLLMFCVAIGTIADFRQLSGSPVIFTYCAFAVFGSVIVHYALAALFRIDADTVIITSTAAVYSPPFVPAIAGVLKNKEIVVSGLTTGLVGYAVGNYLGLALAYLLKP